MIEAQVDTVVVSPVVEVEVDLEAEDLLSEAIEKCSQPSVVTAARNAKFLLNPQTANRFTAATVLRK